MTARKRIAWFMVGLATAVGFFIGHSRLDISEQNLEAGLGASWIALGFGSLVHHAIRELRGTATASKRLNVMFFPSASILMGAARFVTTRSIATAFMALSALLLLLQIAVNRAGKPSGQTNV